jgi:hypothetical protein
VVVTNEVASPPNILLVFNQHDFVRGFEGLKNSIGFRHDSYGLYACCRI